MTRLLAFLLFCTALLSGRCQQAPRQGEEQAGVWLKAGAASAPVNPALGSFIAGDKQNRRFTGPHAPYLTSMSVGRQAGPKIMQTLEELIPK